MLLDFWSCRFGDWWSSILIPLTTSLTMALKRSWRPMIALSVVMIQPCTLGGHPFSILFCYCSNFFLWCGDKRWLLYGDLVIQVYQHLCCATFQNNWYYQWASHSPWLSPFWFHVYFWTLFFFLSLGCYLIFLVCVFIYGNPEGIVLCLFELRKFI